MKNKQQSYVDNIDLSAGTDYGVDKKSGEMWRRFRLKDGRCVVFDISYDKAGRDQPISPISDDHVIFVGNTEASKKAINRHLNNS